VIQSFDNNFFKDIIDNLSTTVQKLAKFFGINIEACLPHPTRTDLQIYFDIGTLLSVCWLLLILEPIAMRLRTIIMHHMYPEIGLQRAAWLYKRILRKRSHIFSFTEKQRRFSYHDTADKVSEESKSCWESLKRRILR
jgi:hypothetical protein